MKKKGPDIEAGDSRFFPGRGNRIPQNDIQWAKKRKNEKLKPIDCKEKNVKTPQREIIIWEAIRGLRRRTTDRRPDLSEANVQPGKATS